MTEKASWNKCNDIDIYVKAATRTIIILLA